MNSPNLSSGDRDLESLRRAQQAHESSMEEILASIRSIIEDDEDRAPASARAQNAGAAGGPQIVYSNDSIPPARPVARTPDAAPLASGTPSDFAPPAPRVVWKTPRPGADAPVASTLALRAAAVDEEPLVSPEADAAIESAFNALSASIAIQSSGRIETLTREMLRPLLKTWLDDILPGLVERLVRAEIQRVARSGR
jgi:cell pole-organizing protein PopZ